VRKNIIDNRQSDKINELIPSAGIKKRFDTSGHATAELINELQKRGTSKGVSNNESEN